MSEKSGKETIAIGWKYEETLRIRGFERIAGVDEAGRGPLAGAVYTAAVILPLGKIIPGLDDSKKLTDKKRRMFFDIIKEEATDFCIASAGEREIDELNILNATFQAMNRAIEGLQGVDYALIDGDKMRGCGVPFSCLVKGDQKSYSIAAASILAKVSRDILMEELAEVYPQYGFEKHKGYGTKDHIAAIREFGPCEIHRKTFLKKLI